jgi:hypothetical protein
MHFMRNVLARVPKASAEMVAAAVRTIFAQPDAAHVRSQLEEVTRMLASQFPDVATMVADAAEDLLAFTGFPQAHWRKLWSTNPLERLNAEIKRRTNVVGIFPNDASMLRLVSAVVVETHDEWAVAERRYLSEESMAKLKELDTSARPLPRSCPWPSRLEQDCRRRDLHVGVDLHHSAGRDRDLEVAQHLGEVLALVEQPVAFSELAHDLLGGVSVSLYRDVLLPRMLGFRLPQELDHHPGPRSWVLRLAQRFTPILPPSSRRNYCHQTTGAAKPR